MTRVIHTGDTHLGYRQYHSPQRREDFLDAFRRVVADAVDGEVDAVVHAGDLFHDRTPALADVHGAIRILRDLRDAGIPFLAIVGNHERTHGGQWLDLFETLGLATRLGDEPERVGDVAFYGLDFVPRSKRDGLDYDFAPHDADFAALVAHGLFTPFNAEWNTREVLSSSSVGFDAMLLGDDHQPDTARVEGAWVTYCGSTERTSAAEREERGYNIVEFDAEAAEGSRGSGVSIRRRGIETRSFVTLDIELAEGEGAERVRERLREEALEDAVVIVSVDGDGEEIQPAGIEAFADDRGALVARVTDRREIEAAGIDAVSFADPDAAVTERIRELGLSEAALAIDETVRSDVADSNVRGRVRERIEDALDDPSAFEPGEPVEADDEGIDRSERSTEPEATEAVPEGQLEPGGEDADETDGADHGPAEPSNEPGSADAGAEPAAEAESETDGEAGTSRPTAVAADEDSDDAATAEDEGDGQVTMEDYL